MKKIFAATAPVLLLVMSLLAAGAGRAYAGPREIAYRVDLTRPETGRVTVTLEMEADSQPLNLEMRDSCGHGLAVDLASHIVNESAMDQSGKALSLSKAGNTWRIDGTGIITLSYDVDLSGYETGTDYLNSLADSGLPWPYFPFLDTDLAYIPGYAVFIHPPAIEDYKPRLELALPPGWRQALPWADQPGNLEKLLGNPLYAGELLVKEQGSLVLALPSASAAASGTGLPEYADKARSLLSETENLLGGLEQTDGERILVALLFRGEGDRATDLYYPQEPFSSSIALPGTSRNELLSDFTIEATARNMADLVVASKINLDPEAGWLKEGAARYFQDMVPYRAGIWGGRTFWDLFDRHYDVYRDARKRFPGSLAESGSRAPWDSGAASVLECGGDSACAALDSDLKALQPLAYDLATLMRNLAGLKNNNIPLGNDDIRSMLENMTGRDWSSFFRDYIHGAEEIPASSFSSLNIARPENTAPPAEDSKKSTSTAAWIMLAIAIIIVFLIPFILEPYTMRPRKPGFLDRTPEEEEEREDEE